MELSVDKPNKAEKCHMFEKDDLKVREASRTLKMSIVHAPHSPVVLFREDIFHACTPQGTSPNHLFFRSQKLLGDVLDAKVFFTKVNAPGMCEAHPCNSNPCLHGGECQEDAAGYKCLCKVGWSGNDCENDVNECLGGE